MVVEEEKIRLEKMMNYEKKAYRKGYQFIAGLDEAGRGSLAGPVVAAACILPQGYLYPNSPLDPHWELLDGINDSKQLTSKTRRDLFDRLKSDPAIIWSIGIIEASEIDRINIYQATIRAMLQAIDRLGIHPDCLFVDGMGLPYPTLPCHKIVGGDRYSLSIASASIFAKETRDDLMRDYHKRWPLYGFDQHKGYGTPKHLETIERHGPCPLHRFSFNPVSKTE